MVDEPIQGDRAPVPPGDVAGDAERRNTLPQVAPAVGEDARSHDGRRRQEGQDVLQEPVRERAQAVGTADRSLPLAPRGPAHHRHSVEHVAGVRPGIANKTRAASEASRRAREGSASERKGRERVGTHCAIASPVCLLLASPALAMTSGRGRRVHGQKRGGENRTPNWKLEDGWGTDVGP